MSNLVQQLNANSGLLQLVFSFVVALSTLVYALLTWILVSETRRMRRAQTEAKVTVQVVRHPDTMGFVDILFRNEGTGPARDIHFDARLENPGVGDASLVEVIKSIGFVHKGLDYLSAGAEHRSFFAALREDFEQKMATAIRVDVRYRVATGAELKDSYLLDLSVFRNMSRLGDPPLASMASSMKSLQKDVHDLATGWKKLQVITQNLEDKRRDDRESRIAMVERAQLDRLKSAQDQADEA